MNRYDSWKEIVLKRPRGFTLPSGVSVDIYADNLAESGFTHAGNFMSYFHFDLAFVYYS